MNKKIAVALALAMLFFTLTSQTAYSASIIKRTLDKGAGWVRIFVTGVANDSNEQVYVGRLEIYVDGSRAFSLVVDKVIPPKQTLYLGLNITLQAPSGERRIEVRVYGSGLQIIAQDISIVYIPYPWEEWIEWLITPAPLKIAPIHVLIMALIVISISVVALAKRRGK